MKKALLAVAALTCLGTAALAGPNEGGTLILALSEGTVYSPDIDYCGSVTTPDCASAVTEGVADDVPVVISVLAAFDPPGRLMGIVWGWNYDSNVVILDYGGCGFFELPQSDWPASGSGTALTWEFPQVSNLVPVYWAAAYAYSGTVGSLNLGLHPTQGGQFADDSIPAVIDDIAGFGSFGFGQPGSVVCPAGGPTDGACCIGFECTIQTEADCVANGGVYQGDDTVCEPATCGVEPAEGACCFAADCVITTQEICERDGGNYRGDDSVCDPNPCAVPVFDTSWGSLKSNYR